MGITMNMCSYKIEHDTVEDYGDEVLCAGWNPQLAQIGNKPAREMDKHAALACEMANVDVDSFLQKMYEYQC